MKIYNNKYLPEIGHCFILNNSYYLTCPLDIEAEEVEIDTDNITKIIPNHFNIDNKFEIVLSDKTKKKMVNAIFSNDDQIAIMLNYQASKTTQNKEIYNLMQGWREWISIIINKCKELQNEQQN